MLGNEGGAVMAGFKFDQEKCTACGACAVACMDQNDTDLKAGERPLRTVYKKETPDGTICISESCRHCEDARCIEACPWKCISRDEETGLVIYDDTSCTGCAKCMRACRYRAISFRKDRDGFPKMRKCDGCIGRLRAGLEPACTLNCPTGALKCILL